MTTKIKICGITRQQDAVAAIDAGADALGLNFVPNSPRRLSTRDAALISSGVRGKVLRVGLFVDAPRDEVARVLDEVELDLLQFHGDESPEECASYGKPYMKAIRVRGPLDICALEAAYQDACCFLLDAYVPGMAGGTGKRFDWRLWPRDAKKKLVLAGGLTVENVAEAITQTRPWGVDVSGGVEGEIRGEKDAQVISRFISEVRRAGS